MPIIQAGMGGVARSELVAATAEAGAFGLLGMVREKPEFIVREIAAVRACTDRSFGVNLVPHGADPILLAEELEACFVARVPPLCLLLGGAFGPETDLRIEEEPGLQSHPDQAIRLASDLRGALPQGPRAVS